MITALIILTLAASLASACAGGDDSQASRARTGRTNAEPPPRPTATTTAPDPATAALAAYQRFWKVWLAANDPPNPDDPRLTEVAINPELSTEKAAIAEKVAEGTYSRLPANSKYHHMATISVAGASQVVVADCAVDDILVLHRDDNTVVNNAIATQTISGYLTMVDGTWKVSNIDIVKQVMGVQPCS